MNNDLVDRLNGKYRVPINDGAGLLNGLDYFERQFPTSPLAKEAATALTEARDSAACWRRVVETIATVIGLPEPEADFASKVRDAFDDLRSQLHDANGVADLAIKHRDAAESELSTLRAHVREVVGPFAGDLPGLTDDTIWTVYATAKEVRAARQLMEEVK